MLTEERSLSTGRIQPPPDMSVFRPALPVERRTSPSREEYERDYLEGRGKPVVLTDAARSWPALQKWSFDFFAEKYGDQQMVAINRLFRPSVGRRVKIADFMTYCQFPSASSFKRSPDEPPFYFNFKPFSKHPELLEDFAQPSVVDNFYDQFTGELQKWYLDHFSYLFIGPPGTLTPLHVDLLGTHAWLSQIAGRKHFVLFGPEDHNNLYGGQASLVNPDFKAMPLLRNAQPYEAIIHPGEVVFFPGGWYHHVVALDPSITLTFNFVNKTNFALHLLEICRDLPRWVKRIDVPEFRRRAGITWGPRDFEVSSQAASSAAGG